MAATKKRTLEIVGAITTVMMELATKRKRGTSTDPVTSMTVEGTVHLHPTHLFPDQGPGATEGATKSEVTSTEATQEAKSREKAVMNAASKVSATRAGMRTVITTRIAKGASTRIAREVEVTTKIAEGKTNMTKAVGASFAGRGAIGRRNALMGTAKVSLSLRIFQI